MENKKTPKETRADRIYRLTQEAFDILEEIDLELDSIRLAFETKSEEWQQSEEGKFYDEFTDHADSIAQAQDLLGEIHSACRPEGGNTGDYTLD